MFKKLKIKLGLIKKTDEEILELLTTFHNHIAESIIDGKIVSHEKVEEQKVEVLLFLWVSSGVPFLFNCKNENFKEILNNNIWGIIFDGVKNDYEDEVFENIYKSRREIYNNLMKSDGFAYKDYLKLTNKLLFEAPFEETTDKEEREKLDLSFDFMGEFMETIQVSEIIKHTLPVYKKALEDLSNMTRSKS